MKLYRRWQKAIAAADLARLLIVIRADRRPFLAGD
jgi:hypothetical protein